VQLAQEAGHRVNMPPREQLGSFTEPGDCEQIGAWLRACPDRHVVVSLDMLCYGGLVASRSAAVSAESAIARLDAVRRLRQGRPDAVIFAFSVLMRLGATVVSPETLELHNLLRAYSQLVDRVERLGEEAARGELDDVSAGMDPEVLAGYLEARRRNHAVNRAAIQLAGEGVVDYLVLAQEDAAPVGLHIPEQLALRDQVEEYRVGDRVSIHPGADEVGLVLTARHGSTAAGRVCRIAVDYASQAGAGVVPLFETQAIQETAESQIRAAGGCVAAPAEAEAILFVHTPTLNQVDVSEAPPMGQAPGLALQAESIVARLQAAAAAGYKVGLADVAYCNGADPEMIAALERSGAARRLSAYAGWNTAANSIGTAVSQLCLQVMGSAGPRTMSAAQNRFLAARLIDDYGYQSCVRQRAMERAGEAGANGFALGSAWREFEEYVNQELAPLAHRVASDLLGLAADDPVGAVRASLPWHRLFEVGVEIAASRDSKNRR
jgi:hypothetical protein